MVALDGRKSLGVSIQEMMVNVSNSTFVESSL